MMRGVWGPQSQCCLHLFSTCTILILLRYREASVEVMGVMSRFAVIERASIDEAYVDLTSAVRERLQKQQGQPISADLLSTTYIEGLPQGSTTAEGTVQKGTS